MLLGTSCVSTLGNTLNGKGVTRVRKGYNNMDYMDKDF